MSKNFDSPLEREFCGAVDMEPAAAPTPVEPKEPEMFAGLPFKHQMYAGMPPTPFSEQVFHYTFEDDTPAAEGPVSPPSERVIEVAPGEYEHCAPATQIPVRWQSVYEDINLTPIAEQNIQQTHRRILIEEVGRIEAERESDVKYVDDMRKRLDRASSRIDEMSLVRQQQTERIKSLEGQVAALEAERDRALAALRDARRFVSGYCGPFSEEVKAIDAVLAQHPATPAKTGEVK